MKKIFCKLLIILLVYSCKKQELNGDLTYLEGKWKLYALINNFDGSITYSEGFSFNKENMRFLEIKKNGCIILYNNQNKIIERGRFKIYTSSPSNIYPNGIFYQVEIGSNSVFNRTLNKMTYFMLISTNQTPYEFIINDIIYRKEYIDLVFQKM